MGAGRDGGMDILDAIDEAIQEIEKDEGTLGNLPLADDITNSCLDMDGVKKIRHDLKILLNTRQVGRRVVDLHGPFGWEFASVNTGMYQYKQDGDQTYTLRSNIPVIELRQDFTIQKDDYGVLKRGGNLLDRQPLINAVDAICNSENKLIFHNAPQESFQGVLKSSPFEPLEVKNASYLFQSILEAINILSYRGIPEPYTLLMNTAVYIRTRELFPKEGIMDKLRKLEKMDRLIHSPIIDGVAIMSTASGNYELHFGKDMMFGYEKSTDLHHHFYLMETLAFIVKRPDACIQLKIPDMLYSEK